MSLLSFTSRNAINVSSTITRTITKKINHNNAILGYSKRGFSFAVTFQKQQQQQQQQQQYQRLLVCSTSTKFSTMIMAKPTTSDNIKANSNTNTNTNMAMMSSNSRRTMVTSSNKGYNEGKISSSIISNRGGAMIPNVLLMANNSSSNNIDTNKNNNASELMEKMMIHLPPPDDPVGLQLYKKALYCPLSQILRTSLHVGSDDFNQKVEGIVVAVAGSGVGNDITHDAITGSDTQLKEVSIDEARNHARNSGLRLLATIHDYLQGDLSRVEQILTITGIVNSNNNSTYPTDNKNNNNSSMSSRNPITTTSQYHGSIIDGCSQVFAEAFGKEIGIGTRVCYGGNIGSTVACYVELRICPS
mmetsp:Transcript_35488/g.38415  ORF Transcript_35488/g.38415 Transcript_35488/m.38415 type:complete len:359 (+) Transcript_35488:166-1242(+)